MAAIGDFTEVNNLTFGDWQRDYLYKLIIVKEPTAPAFAQNKGSLDKDQIDAYCDAVPVPASKQSVIKKLWGGKWANFSGKLESANTVTLTFRLDEAAKLYRYLNAWHELSGSDASGASVQKALYQGQIALALYKTDKETVGGGYLLDHAWIAELGDLDLDKQKGELLSIQVTVAYDQREPYSPK